MKKQTFALESIHVEYLEFLKKKKGLSKTWVVNMALYQFFTQTDDWIDFVSRETIG